ncbi:MAG TPA: SDR family NAD(P)-dependent oxidoreductase [Bacteroidia bacterium]|nr:SDR family NAD(P)-dependent oxidoreductase [Bacteroidia bacterium]
MKKILITGAGGFIGSHLAERCAESGYKVKAFVRYNSKNNWGWLENSVFKKDIEVVSGDIRDYDSVSAALKGCEEVFHLAALIGIPYSYVSPLAYIKTNVEGTYNILEASRKLNMGNVIITSTSETYGTAQYVPMDENHPLVGQSPYSASKIAADQVALSYFHSFNLPVKVVRPFNTYGPRQSARAIIPTIIAQMLKNEKIFLGNLNPTRDFTYVKDTVQGFIEISKNKKLNGTVTNIGMNEETSINNLTKLIAGLMSKKVMVSEKKERIRPANSEVERLCCDNSRLLKNTKWKPKYNLKKGLEETIDWLRENPSGYKSEIYNI